MRPHETVCLWWCEGYPELGKIQVVMIFLATSAVSDPSNQHISISCTRASVNICAASFWSSAQRGFTSEGQITVVMPA